jgi:hypothetical protein
MGFGAGPIPWSDIANYAIVYGLVGEEFLDFIYLIRSMDAAWCNWMIDNQSKTPPPKKK